MGWHKCQQTGGPRGFLGGPPCGLAQMTADQRAAHARGGGGGFAGGSHNLAAGKGKAVGSVSGHGGCQDQQTAAVGASPGTSACEKSTNR